MINFFQVTTIIENDVIEAVDVLCFRRRKYVNYLLTIQFICSIEMCTDLYNLEDDTVSVIANEIKLDHVINCLIIGDGRTKNKRKLKKGKKPQMRSKKGAKQMLKKK